MATYFQSSFTWRDRRRSKRLNIFIEECWVKTKQYKLIKTTHRKICIFCSEMFCDVRDPLQGWYHCRRQSVAALHWTLVHRRSVPVQAQCGASLLEEVTEGLKGGRRERRNPRSSGCLHPKRRQVICVWVTVKVTVVNFISSIQGVNMAVAVATIVIPVSMEIDVRLLGDPGGRDGGEVRSQVTPPEKTKGVSEPK